MPPGHPHEPNQPECKPSQTISLYMESSIEGCAFENWVKSKTKTSYKELFDK